MTAEPDLGVLLAAACERIVREILGELAAAGYPHLTPSQSLAVLFIGDGLDTVTQLADRLNMTTQAISKICATLSAEGLLERQPNEGDARSRRLALTPAGAEAVTRMRAAGAAAEQLWTDLVGPETLTTVRNALAAFAYAPTSPTASPIRIRFS
ncbi:winged helix-turn-helix transcriptional regulator [Dactylosporangium vinaceum]|uniref:MarR family winged helix-turn-helix transcriptional regulator n=1 Tax=Dactylosporangium vinaceum TaxID=53362 RepID=A0ABV5MPK6_9ACTN|nr:MarR family winged helix-turn-helix transcriptional regulator [Dactylosporangium vinaceum]UAB96743.1 winged helix-turn-helix transcriptional regulator [Dactylosporangium vinaceum]